MNRLNWLLFFLVTAAGSFFLGSSISLNLAYNRHISDCDSKGDFASQCRAIVNEIWQ